MADAFKIAEAENRKQLFLSDFGLLPADAFRNTRTKKGTKEMHKESPMHIVETDSNPPSAAPDPFSVQALRLDQSFEEKSGVRKLVTTVPVRKPSKQEWIRVHPDEAFRNIFAVIKLEEAGEFYILAPAIARELTNETLKVTIYTVINKQGVVFLWPVRVPDPEGRINTWHTSAIEAAEMAMKRSVRVKANMALGAYEIALQDDPIPENDPVWPDLSFTELLAIGFRKVGRYVDSFEHPVVKQLQGRP